MAILQALRAPMKVALQADRWRETLTENALRSASACVANRERSRSVANRLLVLLQILALAHRTFSVAQTSGASSQTASEGRMNQFGGVTVECQRYLRVMDEPDSRLAP